MRVSYVIKGLVLFSSLSILSCGGGGGGSSNDDSSSGYSGSTSSATVDETNGEAISRTVNEVAARSASYEGASGLFRSSAASSGDVSDVISRVKQQAEEALRLRFGNVAARIDETEPCANGGTLRVIFPTLNANDTVVPQRGSGSFIFDNCDEFDEVIDGRADVTWNGFDQQRGFVNYSLDVDLSYRVEGTPATSFVGTVSCSNYGADCVSTEDFVTADGGEVRVEDVVVTGNNITGYDMTARVYNEIHGYVDVIASDIVVCSNGNIQSGDIQVIDFTGLVVLFVVFSDCDEFTVTYNGVATIYTQ